MRPERTPSRLPRSSLRSGAAAGAGKVVVGYVHPESVKASFHDSLLNLLVADMAGDRAVVDGGGRIARYSSANVSLARNDVARRFLDDFDAEWLLMLDADMVFGPDLLERLLTAAVGAGAPIVGALCFGHVDGELFPTLYAVDTSAEPIRMRRFAEWPPDQMFAVNATGAATMLVHRSVLETMRERFPEPFPWFREEVLGEPPWGRGAPGTGSPMGEDVTFCLRAGVCGFPVYVHTGIDVGHDKHWILTAEQYAQQRAWASAPHRTEEAS